MLITGQGDVSETPGERATATRLSRALLAKSLLELAFVCGLVVYAAFANFHPLVRGAIDLADETRVAGWAHDPLKAGDVLEVQLFIDDQFVAAQRANESRPDLVAARVAAHPDHGFSFRLAPLTPGRHTAQVYAVRPSFGSSKTLLPLAKTPLVFEAGSSVVVR